MVVADKRKQGKGKQRDFIPIMVRQATYARFKQLSGSEGKTLAGFLDDVSEMLIVPMGGCLEMIPKTPQQAVMDRLSVIEYKVNVIAEELDGMGFFIKNKAGELVRVTPRPGDIATGDRGETIIDAVLRQKKEEKEKEGKSA